MALFHQANEHEWLHELFRLFLRYALSGMLLSVALFLVFAYGLYRLANDCGLSHAWMAWVPILNIYLVGKLSDDCMLAQSGRRTYMRRILPGLAVGDLLATGLFSALIFYVGLGWFSHLISAILGGSTEQGDKELGLILMLIPIIVVIFLAFKILSMVFSGITLYRIYLELSPQWAVLFTALSLLIPQSVPVIFVILAQKFSSGNRP